MPQHCFPRNVTKRLLTCILILCHDQSWTFSIGRTNSHHLVDQHFSTCGVSADESLFANIRCVFMVGEINQITLYLRNDDSFILVMTLLQDELDNIVLKLNPL